MAFYEEYFALRLVTGRDYLRESEGKCEIYESSK